MNSMFDAIKRLLCAVWSIIKKIAVVVARFLSNVVAFFKDPNMLGRLKSNQNSIAVSIKEKLENGDYQVVNCLFDQQTCELIDPDVAAQVVTASDIDAEMAEKFGDKSMLVLK